MSIFSVLLSCIVIAFSGGLIYLSATVRDMYAQVPSDETISEAFQTKSQNSFLYDKHGTLLYTFKDPNVDREYLFQDEINDKIRLAVLAAEDKDFYIHHGMDYIAMLRGLVTSISGDQLVGGSTITQQLAKNTFLTNETTIERKIKEAILSAIIENEYEKEQILEYYLNTVPFGSRVTGLKTAAKVYFSKPVDQLSFNEISFLIGMVQSPTQLSPIYSFDQQKAWEANDARRNYILNQALSNYEFFDIILEDIPTKEELEEYMSTDIEISPYFSDIKAPHYVFYIESILAEEPYNISRDELYTGGYKIHTTLDYNIQKIAENRLPGLVGQYGPRYGFDNAALMTIDPRNGAILAMQGSKDYWAKKDKSGRFDPEVNVTLSSQNLGSSLKPFLAYMAFDSGRYSRYSIIYDTPKTFAGGYKPKNVDGRFLGPLTVDKALKYSRNLPFVKINDEVGVNAFNNLLKNLGYSNAEAGAQYGLAASLGGVSETLYDHAFAYSTMASGGFKVEPYPISKIEKIDSEEVREFKPKQERLLNEGAVRQVNRIIGDKSYRSDNHWMVYLGRNYKFAGKTGTTDYNKQNYYVGYSPRILTAVWTGNNNNDRMSSRAFGSTTAMPIWYEYTKNVLDKHPEYIEWGSW